MTVVHHVSLRPQADSGPLVQDAAMDKELPPALAIVYGAYGEPLNLGESVYIHT